MGDDLRRPRGRRGADLRRGLPRVLPPVDRPRTRGGAWRLRGRGRAAGRLRVRPRCGACRAPPSGARASKCLTDISARYNTGGAMPAPAAAAARKPRENRTRYVVLGMLTTGAL